MRFPVREMTDTGLGRGWGLDTIAVVGLLCILEASAQQTEPLFPAGSPQIVEPLHLASCKASRDSGEKLLFSS